MIKQALFVTGHGGPFCLAVSFLVNKDGQRMPDDF